MPRQTVSSEPQIAREDRPSALESRIGAQVFNRVGVFAVLAGAAWFLKLAIDHAWIGPGIRVAIGLLTAVALVAWSERFRRQSAPAFSYTLKALGAGIAYLSLWASFDLYLLFPSSIVFAAMVTVTGSITVFAWRQNSELLASLALAGGLATPALLSPAGSQEVFLFSYLLLLDLGALVLISLRPWPRLAFGAFAGTTAYLGFWWFEYSRSASRAVTGAFILIFFAVFTAAPFLALRRKTETSSGATLLTGLPIAVAVAAFFEACRLLTPIANSSSIAWVPATLGGVYLGMTAAGPLLLAQARTPGQLPDRRLRQVHLALAAGFFALAGFLEFHAYGISLCWLAELLLLAGAADRLARHELAGSLRGGASVLLLLSFTGLLLLDEYDSQPARTPAFFNAHFATYLAGLAVFAAIVAFARGRSTPGSQQQSLPSPNIVTPNSWSWLAGAAIVAFNLIALLSVSLQIELFWHQQLSPIRRGHGAFPHPVYVDFTYSAWSMLYGAALMAVGFWRRSAFLRWQALLLLAFSIGKVFLFDTSHLNEGYRVLSFLGLGILLLAISFVYQRDWFALRQERP